MIPISGTTSLLGLRITDATQSSQVETIRNSVQHSRAIENFRTQVKDIETVDQFVDNYEVYSFVMKAFDLEDQIFGKAMIKAALKSNIEDDEALINRLTDPRIKDLYDAMGFGEDGVGNINTILGSWRTKMVDRYVDRIFVNDQAAQNDTVGAALEFRRRAAEIDGPFDVLKNVDTANFMRRVLGLPDQIVWRQPFPGPGLAIRIPGEVTAEKVEILRHADAIYLDEIRNHGLYDAIWQAFAVLLPVQTVGVMGDARTYDFVCTLRAVTSTDGMTADSFPFDHEFLTLCAGRIINEVRGINRVVYDVTSKPPGTIEWE